MRNSIFLKKRKLRTEIEFKISGSKSESNRLLILNALYHHSINILNLSDAEDTRLLQKALASDSRIIDIHHAGTAMRFLTAYLSICDDEEFIITGSERMKQRPIGVLVDALKSMGGQIEYLEKTGFPPLKIIGNRKLNNTVTLSAGISSQFISALMLIAPKLESGLTIELTGKITSKPYLEMTASVLKRAGIDIEFDQNKIKIRPAEKLNKMNWEVESDYSSLSYFYSVAALGGTSVFKINNFVSDSLQGDRAVSEIYRKYFGVESYFEKNQIVFRKNQSFVCQPFEINLNDTPDLAQTLAVTAAALKIKCKLNGLETLRIKETDRLQALYVELKKVGAVSVLTKDSIALTGFSEPEPEIIVKTYNDHRMAMAFAPLCVLTNIEIENPGVVEKSYPNFWIDFENCFE